MRSQPNTCKHIAKAAQPNAATKALSKSLQVPAPRKEKQKISLRFAKIKSADTQTDRRILMKKL